METGHTPKPLYRLAHMKDKLSDKKESHSRMPLTAVTNSVLEKRFDSVKQDIVDDENTRYICEKLLGKGGFASVFLLKTDDIHRHEYAGKIICKRRIQRPEKKDKIAREIDIHRRLSHENVVQFVKFFEDIERVVILMENCGGMTLSKILRARNTLTEAEARYYLRQLLSGCEHIHSKGIVHRDLKLSNLFITDTMRLKIGDFGLSTYISGADDKKESICGTPNYISPEVIHKIGHSFPADVWAIGCIVYALLSGRPPFETDSLRNTYKLISKSKYNEPGTASLNARSLIGRCLLLEQHLRPSLSELRNDPFTTTEPTPTSLGIEAARHEPEDMKHYCTNYGKSNPIVTMEYLITRIDSVEICAQGGKSFPEFPSSTNACAQLLETLTTTVNKIRGWTSKTNPNTKSVEDFVWITKWVDYSHKYGFGFQLSNGLNGASFKDGFSIAINRRESHVGLQDPSGKVSVYGPVDELSTKYDTQLQVMRYFVKYMDDTLIKGGDATDQKTNALTPKGVFMLRWLRTKDSIVMCLSTGTVQVNWLADHTKLAIARTGTGYQIMYINKKRQSFVYNLADIARHGAMSEVKLRLRYITIVVARLLNGDYAQEEEYPEDPEDPDDLDDLDDHRDKYRDEDREV